MKILAVLVLCLMPHVCHAQTLTPQDARATLTMARAQATAASELATANAPTATTPATWTPQPTNTPTMMPSATMAATETPVPSATSAPTWTPLPIVATATLPAVDAPDQHRSGVPVELWCIIAILLMCAGIGVGMRMVSKWRK